MNALLRPRWPDDPATLDEVMTTVEALRQEVQQLREATPMRFLSDAGGQRRTSTTIRLYVRRLDWPSDCG